jgi:hypothetical protein
MKVGAPLFSLLWHLHPIAAFAVVGHPINLMCLVVAWVHTTAVAIDVNVVSLLGLKKRQRRHVGPMDDDNMIVW